MKKIALFLVLIFVFSVVNVPVNAQELEKASVSTRTVYLNAANYLVENGIDYYYVTLPREVTYRFYCNVTNVEGGTEGINFFMEGGDKGQVVDIVLNHGERIYTQRLAAGTYLVSISANANCAYSVTVND